MMIKERVLINQICFCCFFNLIIKVGALFKICKNEQNLLTEIFED